MAIALTVWLSHGHWWGKISGRDLIWEAQGRLPDIRGPGTPESLCDKVREFGDNDYDYINERRCDCSKIAMRYEEICCRWKPQEPNDPYLSPACQHDRCVSCSLRLTPSPRDEYEDGRRVLDVFADCAPVDKRWEGLLEEDAPAPSIVGWVGEMEVEVENGEMVSAHTRLEEETLRALIKRTKETSESLVGLLADAQASATSARYMLLDADVCAAENLEDLKAIYDGDSGDIVANTIRYAWFQFPLPEGVDFGPHSFLHGKKGERLEDLDWLRYQRLTSDRWFCVLESQDSALLPSAKASRRLLAGRLPLLTPLSPTSEAPDRWTNARIPWVGSARPGASDPAPVPLVSVLEFESSRVSGEELNRLVVWGEPKAPSLVAGQVTFWVLLGLALLVFVNLALLVIVNLVRIFGSGVKVVQEVKSKDD